MTNRFYNAFDSENYGGLRKPDYRSVFQMDRDRIIHAHAFRKLQSKTQVFLSGEYEFYRTRLTHSMEVAQIGRSICHFLRSQSGPLSADFHIDSDLVEAVCLAHDLGHPPFGHSGERTLQELMVVLKATPRRCTCSRARCFKTNPACAACSRPARCSTVC